VNEDRSDVSRIEFRNPDVRYRPRRERESGTPFWRIVGAVFTALCLFGLLQTVVAIAVIRQAMDDFNRSVEALVPRVSPATAPASPPTQTVPRRRAVPSLPAYPGPIEARRAGLPQACIGGFVSDRIEGGWSQTRQRCMRSSE
jgi:hypothetical protein